MILAWSSSTFRSTSIILENGGLHHSVPTSSWFQLTSKALECSPPLPQYRAHRLFFSSANASIRGLGSLSLKHALSMNCCCTAYLSVFHHSAPCEDFTSVTSLRSPDGGASDEPPSNCECSLPAGCDLRGSAALDDVVDGNVECRSGGAPEGPPLLPE